MATGESVLSTEEQAALRRKRVNVRRAHRASTTKSINQIDGAIESNDVRRLRQLKQSLTGKLTVLAKLNEDILELTDESELEAEVEQADETQEKIDLAILTTEDALVPHPVPHSTSGGRKERSPGSTHRAGSTPSIASGKEDRPVSSTPASVLSASITRGAMSLSSLSVTTAPPSLPPWTTTPPSLPPWTTTSVLPHSSTVAHSVEPTTSAPFDPITIPSSGCLCPD